MEVLLNLNPTLNKIELLLKHCSMTLKYWWPCGTCNKSSVPNGFLSFPTSQHSAQQFSLRVIYLVIAEPSSFDVDSM